MTSCDVEIDEADCLRLAECTANGNNPYVVETPFWQTLPDDARFYNFAYGANLSADSIARRKLEPIESLPVRLPGFRLNFGLPGLPLVEPSFGDIEATGNTSEHEIHGVCHLLTKTGWRRLQTTEGGGGVDRQSYIPHKVRCITYDGRTIEAYALMSERKRALQPPLGFYSPPSARYLDKIVTGGTKFGLDQRYVDAVKACAVTEPSLFGKIYLGAIALCFAPVVLVAFGVGRLFGVTTPSRNPVILNVVRLAWFLSWPFIPASGRLAKPVSVSIKPRL
jgi:hypothetical protein